MALFGSSSAASPATTAPEQQEIKTALMRQLQQEAAMNNARQLIGVRLDTAPAHSLNFFQ